MITLQNFIHGLNLKYVIFSVVEADVLRDRSLSEL